MIVMPVEKELVHAIVYDGEPAGRPVRLLLIPDDHVIFEREGFTLTMGEVLAVGLPGNISAGTAYVMLEPGDRDPH